MSCRHMWLTVSQPSLLDQAAYCLALLASKHALPPCPPLCCRQIPKSPLLLESSDGTNTYVTSMPPCPGDPTDSSGGLSGGAIAGIVIGCVAAGAGEPRGWQGAPNAARQRQAAASVYSDVPVHHCVT